MVEQTRQPSRAVSLQAGPGGLNSGTQFDTNLRYSTCPPARLFVIIKQPKSKGPRLMQLQTPLDPRTMSQNANKIIRSVKHNEKGLKEIGFIPKSQERAL